MLLGNKVNEGQEIKLIWSGKEHTMILDLYLPSICTVLTGSLKRILFLHLCFLSFVCFIFPLFKLLITTVTVLFFLLLVKSKNTWILFVSFIYYCNTFGITLVIRILYVTLCIDLLWDRFNFCTVLISLVDFGPLTSFNYKKMICWLSLIAAYSIIIYGLFLKI